MAIKKEKADYLDPFQARVRPIHAGDGNQTMLMDDVAGLRLLASQRDVCTAGSKTEKTHLLGSLDDTASY